MGKQAGRKAESATDILEEAVHLLRMAPVELLLIYYLGSLPFVLGLFYFWGDMSRNAFASDYCSVASAGLAVLFIWMKCWQSVFTIKVYEKVSHAEISNWSAPVVLRMITIQTVIHATGFFVLPIALLITIPYPWVYAFYQNVLIQDYREKNSLKAIMSRTLKLNMPGQQQNYLLLLTLTLFQLFVLLNIGVAFYAVPFLAKKLFGFETMITMGGFSYLNSTYVIAVFGFTYLCIDPVVKTVYALRYFYAESEQTGADLTARLKRITLGRGQSFLLVLFVLPFLLTPGTAFGVDGKTIDENIIASDAYGISPEKLDNSIEEVLNRREFAWRMPRDDNDPPPEDSGLFGSFLKWLKPWVKSVFQTLERWIKSFWEWLEKIMPEFEPKDKDDKSGSGFNPKFILLALLAVTTGILIFFLIKMLIARRSSGETEEILIQPVPDITDENIKADDMPSGHWLELAQTLVEKGEFRLAVRALYLGTLSKLSENSLITVARHKSNREYEQELVRRAHDKKEMLLTFGDTVGFFDRVWYGEHIVSRDDVDYFSENQMRIISFAQQEI